MAGAGETTKYPPSEFSQKYAKVLAPDGKLISPDEVFGEGKRFDKDVEEKTRLAFKVTLKKLEKMNIVSEKNKANLELEKIDQIVECFPNTMPKNLPDKLSKMKWTKKAAEVKTWEDWWEMHEEISKMLGKQRDHIKNWWEYIAAPYPGDDAILNSLRRLVSGVLTHPITIGIIVFHLYFLEYFMNYDFRKGYRAVHAQEEEGQAQVHPPDGHGPARGHHDLRRLLHGDPGRQPPEPDQADPGEPRPCQQAACQ